MYDKIKNDTKLNNSTNDLVKLFQNKLKIEDNDISNKLSNQNSKYSDNKNPNMPKEKTSESNENERKIEL